MTRLAALWLIAVGLMAVVAWEIADAPSAEVAPTRQRAAASASAAPAPDADLKLKWVATALTRPLFSPDRRPVADSAVAGAGLSALPRLTAILVGPFGRKAIFAGDDRKPLVMQVGARISTYTIQAIDLEQVRVVGPDGVRVLYPTFEAAPANGQGAPAAQPQTRPAASP